MHASATFSVVAFACLAVTQLFEQQAVIIPENQHTLGNTGSRQETSASSALREFWYNGPRNNTGFVAFGDSYSAGIGTGVDGKEDDCRQGLHAHAQLIAADRGPTAFQFLSCTGATTANVMAGGENSQIDSFNASLPADFALLSVGGNDLGFFDVMNACVFRFYNFYSGTCETAIAHSRANLESDEFEIRLRIVIMEILDKIRWEKKPRFTITMTGYARFFNELTDGCDDMSFGIWWYGPKLTKKLRADMNALVLTVNAKLHKTINAINADFTEDKVLFVDYDDAFEGHRFCEPNVTEPDYGRADTWFFLVGGQDNARNGTQSRRLSDIKTLSPTSPLVDPSSCLEPARRTGDWGMLALCYMAMAKHRDPTLRFAHENIVVDLSSRWYVPTYYGKTFHPRSLGHETIRDQIYKKWRALDG
ncbi:SGNH hydrolase-type esterase domain-containing protein [Xylaria flabelliformis]|nr:SGNH hydrolase-type esterase domain-containing protein [Xylaria flabelliformis]